MKRAMIILFLGGALVLSSCNLPNHTGTVQPPTLAFDTKVALTLTAVHQVQLRTPSTTGVPVTPTDTLTPTGTFTQTLTLEPSLTPTATYTVTLTKTDAPTKTPIPKPGTIEGSISGYPYGSLPSLAIVAFQQQAPYNWSYWITAPGTAFFSMTSDYLLPGKWLVVAYDADGHSGGCPAQVTVISEETVTCDITDWSGSYPPKPSGVPFP